MALQDIIERYQQAAQDLHEKTMATRAQLALSQFTDTLRTDFPPEIFTDVTIAQDENGEVFGTIVFQGTEIVVTRSNNEWFWNNEAFCPTGETPAIVEQLVAQYLIKLSKIGTTVESSNVVPATF